MGSEERAVTTFRANTSDASLSPPYAKTDDDGRITDTVSISERPASVEDRAVPGHWEGDLISGSGNSHIATLVGCHSRYVMLARINSKHTETVIKALIKQAHKLPGELHRSLTWDRGKEMAGRP